MEGGFGAGDFLVMPQLLEDRVGSDRGGRPQRQKREQAPGTGTGQLQRLPCGIDDFDGSKQTEIHDGDHPIQ